MLGAVTCRQKHQHLDPQQSSRPDSLTVLAHHAHRSTGRLAPSMHEQSASHPLKHPSSHKCIKVFALSISVKLQLHLQKAA